ncbi:PREDICTED: piggyBac transposable element-derived protein 4-like [Dinoponera quadriceps]|uniref:PiggyBac transposable element-derived protein 4-like n=1 Tax=Dinoponera quadriceps TaxID=609295 RepID=A0A6P3XJ43_DINQU|nr:PREDICTED: piggyBac transposable element-derived protein 4-like [Dinoponera quadriceps]
MEEFRNDSQDNESSDDELKVEVYNENMNNSMYDSVPDNESDSSDDCIVPPKRRNVLRIDNDMENSEGDDEEHLEQIEDSSESDGWEDVTEKDDLPFSFTFKTSPRIVGPQISQDITRPLDFFKLYFTDILIDQIVKTTNEYAQMKIREKQLANNSIWHSWIDVTREEFMAFIGVILNMGTMPLASISEYWTTRSNSRIPFYSEVFRRNRFRQIFWMLHLRDNASSNTSLGIRIGKANNFLQYIDSKFAEHFIPGKDICVDESIVKFKGKIAFIRYNPKKPTKWGIRIYVLADGETGYVYSILPYYGSLTTEGLEKPELPVSSRIPLTLVKKLLDNIPNAEGYHLYTDRYFTSIPLANELLKVKVHLTGTVMPNRKYLPAAIKKPKFSTKSTVAYKKENTLVLAWKSKRIVTFLSTSDAASLESVTTRTRGGATINLLKPIVAIHYTEKMRAVDRADQHAATYCFLRKSLKWWRTLFFWGMEMCVINAYIMHKITRQQNNERPLTHLNFVKCLVDELVENFRHQTPSRAQPSTSFVDIRLNNQLHIIRSGTKKDCAVCSDRKTPGKRRETRTYCDTCTRKPGLHIGDCFAKYHTLENYRN